MKVSKPISLLLTDYLKVSIDNYLNECPPTFKCEKTHLYYILNHILIQQTRNKNRDTGSTDHFIQISQKNLKAKTTNSIGSYLKLLKNGEFIKCNESYKAGKKAKGYCLNPIYLKGNIINHRIDKSHPLFNKILKPYQNKKSHYNRLESHLKAMCKVFMSIELDYDKAYNWAQSVPNDYKRILYTSSVNNIKDKRFRYFQRNKTNNRLDTNLTNLKRELRQFIIGDYVSIDLKNSQPFLLSLLLKSIIRNNEGTLCYLLNYNYILKTFGSKPIKAVNKIHHFKEKEFLANLSYFNESALSGLLYEKFVISYGNGISRDEVKKIILEVMYSQIESYANKKVIFAEVLPTINECINALKINNYKDLSIYLQKLESYIFIDCIAKELVEVGIVPITIHDSIIVQKDHEEKALSIMKNVFKAQLGTIPTFKTEPLNPGF